MSDGMPGAADMHRLRNALNAACIALSVATRLLDNGDAERARERLEDANQACAECRRLLQDS